MVSLGDPLNQTEVNVLPAGTRIMVLWTGGNGPWEYVIGYRYGHPQAYHRLADGRFLWVGELDFVGLIPPFTIVQVIHEDPVSVSGSGG